VGIDGCYDSIERRSENRGGLVLAIGGYGQEWQGVETFVDAFDLLLVIDSHRIGEHVEDAGHCGFEFW
jgi:hypothetical protein